jgi:cytochrome c peroxidase
LKCIDVIVVFSFFFLIGCSSSNEHFTEKKYSYRVPAFFPEMEIPKDNAPTNLRMELGRRLFFEKRLSANQNISCASCHVTSMAFADGQVISKGADGKQGFRNSPTLANLAWAPHFMSEGGVATLELQVLAPIQDTVEMAFPLHEAAALLRKDDYLNKLSQAAYQRELDEYVIIRAIACYERSFISADSRFDRFYYSNQKNELNEAEQRGMQIFFSEKAACSKCHTPPLFTDAKFYNIGLDTLDRDHGLERVTYQKADKGKFKTPTLRNIELTGPYMHDGSLNTLKTVIAFYNMGGHAHPNKSSLIQPMNWTEQEQLDLELFLKSLTDWNFVQNAGFLPLTP